MVSDDRVPAHGHHSTRRCAHKEDSARIGSILLCGPSRHRCNSLAIRATVSRECRRGAHVPAGPLIRALWVHDEESARLLRVACVGRRLEHGLSRTLAVVKDDEDGRVRLEVGRNVGVHESAGRIGAEVCDLGQGALGQRGAGEGQDGGDRELHRHSVLNALMMIIWGILAWLRNQARLRYIHVMPEDMMHLMSHPLDRLRKLISEHPQRDA